MKLQLLANSLATVVFSVGATQQWPIVDLAPARDNPDPNDISRNCKIACLDLKEQYPEQVSFSGEKPYQAELSQFWSLQQSQTHPACIFLPKSAQDVASVISIARKNACKFAAKSGGHVPFAGASNIAGGITIDFAALNEITIHQDKNTVSVGPGNKWGAVYSKLEDKEISVVGGRIADVGVGGLSLGGGISFFSNMHGWACDNIATYEVVLANGDIVNASANSHQDLYWALRGGANNFGLVTRFEMRTYPHEKSLMWVGKILHPWTSKSSLIKAFAEFGENGTDAYATLLFSFVYMQKQDQFISVSEADYATAVEEDAHPEVFDAFFKAPDPVRVSKTTQTVVQVIEEHSASNPNGLRQTYWTATFRLDEGFAGEIVDLWRQEIERIKQQITGYVPVITLQVITVRMMQHMQNDGGNALGLDAEGGPLMIIAPSAMWIDSSHDEVVLSTYAKWLSLVKSRASELGLDHQYLYMNYASQFQDPIRGYGQRNVEKLKRVAKHYDPEGVFKRLQPGYFKL